MGFDHKQILNLSLLILLISISQPINSRFTNVVPNDESIFNQIVWSTMEVISLESNLGSSQPSMASDSNNNLHTLWSDYTDYNGAGTD